MSWWFTIKDKYDYLPMLAIMVFSITPHSAGCESVFSTLEDEVHEMINESTFLQFEEENETDNRRNTLI
ncbi:hypothetical protein GLOIN_2v1768905 [Rhizophagus clarus]|uniref:HAT C-terminal dimerisation domain-containing protein n=1 Tax=Rhizophagus clarus TaxID=94130 RepID=A0A8H3LYW5_9GLOM|nr:hypothetical protein GLOIN_2v1768905 [Rhizophagus clarus]